MRLTVQLRGVNALDLKVKYLIRAAVEGAKAGVSEAAMLLEEEAKTLVPVDTGYLRDHIHSELIESSDTRVVVAVSPAYEEGDIGIAPTGWATDWQAAIIHAAHGVGFDPPYARAVEYGYMGVNAAGRNQHTPAQPYMRPAFDMKREEAREAIKNHIFELLDDAMAKGR